MVACTACARLLLLHGLMRLAATSIVLKPSPSPCPAERMSALILEDGKRQEVANVADQVCG